MVSSERAREIGTMGGCGLLALALLERLPDAVPLLRYNRNGCAVHAAIRVGSRLLHWGDDDGLVEVSREEMAEAVRYDFDAGRVSLKDGELEAVVEMMLNDLERN